MVYLRKRVFEAIFQWRNYSITARNITFYLTMVETPFLRSKTVNEIYETRPISNHQVIIACVPIDSQKIMSMQHVEKVVLNSTYYRRIF